MLTLAIKEPYFLFDGELYQQVGGAAMCSPLGLALANAFLYHYEDIWLGDCSLEYKLSYYKRYVFHIFVLLKSETQVGLFKHFIKTCCPKMIFTFAKEHNKCFNFLDVEVIREIKVFTSSVYRKPTLVVFTRIFIVECRWVSTFPSSFYFYISHIYYMFWHASIQSRNLQN